jgi:hypothetical protein
MSSKISKIIVIGAVVVAVLASAGLAAALVTNGGTQSGNGGTQTGTPSDRDQQIADMATADGGKALSMVCQGMQLTGRPWAERYASKTLGPTIIQAGGSVDQVVDLLLDKC